MSFLPGWSLGLLFAEESALAELAFLQVTNDLSNTNPYPFTDENFGTAHSTREIICVVSWRGNAGTRTIASATIGGVTADIWLQTNDTSPTNPVGIGIISANVPTGTSGTVEITFSGACLRCSIGVYRLINLSSRTPHDADTDINDVVTMALDVPSKGIVIAGCLNIGSGAMTIAGVTVDDDAATGEGSDQFAVASATELSEETARTVSFDGTNVDAAGICMSWS